MKRTNERTEQEIFVLHWGSLWVEEVEGWRCTECSMKCLNVSRKLIIILIVQSATLRHNEEATMLVRRICQYLFFHSICSDNIFTEACTWYWWWWRWRCIGVTTSSGLNDIIIFRYFERWVHRFMLIHIECRDWVQPSYDTHDIINELTRILR